jgi:2-polyprenyl-6-methoxyphenol hydroxylase-like FAD-dependent oxidoreductase
MESLTGKKALISGASIAGLSTAYWMNKLGYKVTVVEIAGEFRLAGGAINVEGPAADAVRRMGILEQIKSKRLNVEMIEFKNAEDVTINSMLFENMVDDLSDDDIEIERDKILHTIYNEIKNDIEIIFNSRIIGLKESKEDIQATFLNGIQQSYDLVFGCDGTHSGVRKIWFGDEAEYSHFLDGYFSITILDKLLIRQKTVQMYNVPNKCIMLNAYSNKTDVIFCFNSADEIPYDYRDMEQQRGIIINQFEKESWRTAELLEEIKKSKTIYFDKFCQIKMPSWTKGRVALVGDAAYCPSPAAGKGGSIAIVGATAIADALQEHNGDYELAFQDYNEKLRPYIEEVQFAAESNVRELVPRTEEELSNRNTHGFSNI